MHALDVLGDLLVEMQLLRVEQWRQARQELGSGADLGALLGRLRTMPAWWAPDGSAPAVSDYQRRWIKRLGERDRMARLKKALRWERYLILQELGEGGMGVVYKGWDLTERRLVAIKRIKGTSVETHRRFRREARIQQHLSHPRIAQFLRLVRSTKSMLLVLEYIQGRTIAQEVKASGPIPWPEAVRWIMDILHALDYVHRLRIIHRDLKPSNIILQKQPDGVRAKLLDLGLAKCLDPSAMTQATTQDVLTVGDALLGTFEYMPPEQWRGADEIVPASDVYSLGCTLFYALTGGRPPFVATSLVAYCNAHTRTPPPPLPAAQPAPPERLNTLLQEMLAKDPAKRRPPADLLEQFAMLLQEGTRSDLPAVVSPVVAPVAPTPPPPSLPRPETTPREPMVEPNTPLPVAASAPAEDRFAPFPPSSPVNIAGLSTFWQAFLRSRRMGWGVFFLLILILVAAGMLAVQLWS